MTASIALELQAQAQELSELLNHIESDHSVSLLIFCCCFPLYCFLLGRLIRQLKPIIVEIFSQLDGAMPQTTMPNQDQDQDQGNTMQKPQPNSQIWKDVTSYQQGKKCEPTTFEARVGALRVVITFGHILHPNQWVMHCKTLGIDTYPLKLWIDLEQAKAEAILLIEERIADLEKCLAEIKNGNQ